MKSFHGYKIYSDNLEYSDKTWIIQILSIGYLDKYDADRISRWTDLNITLMPPNLIRLVRKHFTQNNVTSRHILAQKLQSFLNLSM